ncbi:MAG: hypothetical protein LBD48_07160 [Treponema sp.]|jgi:hypothetical protein|nr:hypothetical protein [Treponema sp.]
MILKNGRFCCTVGFALCFLVVFHTGCIRVGQYNESEHPLVLHGRLFFDEKIPGGIQISVFLNENKEWLGFGDSAEPEQNADGVWVYSWTFSGRTLEPGTEIVILALSADSQQIVSSKTLAVSDDLAEVDMRDSFKLSGLVLHQGTAVQAGTVYIIDRHTNSFQDLAENTVFLGYAMITAGAFNGTVSSASGYLLVSLADGTIFIGKHPVELPLENDRIDTAAMDLLVSGFAPEAEGISQDEPAPVFSGVVTLNGEPLNGGMIFALKTLDGEIEPLGAAEIKEGTFSGILFGELQSGFILANLTNLNGALSTYISRNKYTAFSGMKLDIGTDFTIGETLAAAGGNFTGIISGGSEPVKDGIVYIISRKAVSLLELPDEEPASIGFILNGTFSGSAELASGYLVAGIGADVYISKSEYSAPFTGLRLNIKEMDFLGNWETADYSSFNGHITGNGNIPPKEGIVFIIPHQAKSLADLPQAEPVENVAFIQDGRIKGDVKTASGYLVAGIGPDIYISKTEYRAPFTGLRLNVQEMQYLGNWETADYSSFSGEIFLNGKLVEQGIVYIIPRRAESFEDLPLEVPGENIAFIHDSRLSGSTDAASGYLVVGIGADIYASAAEYTAPFTGLSLDASSMTYLGNWEAAGRPAIVVEEPPPEEPETAKGASTLPAQSGGIRIQAGPARRPAGN